MNYKQRTANGGHAMATSELERDNNKLAKIRIQQA